MTRGEHNSENFEFALGLILNYIYKGLGTMVKEKDFYGTNYFQLLLFLVEKTYRKSVKEENSQDMSCATTILTFILENAKPVGPAIKLMLSIAKFNI